MLEFLKLFYELGLLNFTLEIKSCLFIRIMRENILKFWPFSYYFIRDNPLQITMTYLIIFEKYTIDLI